MATFDLIIFDLDGTLIDSKLDIAHCVNLVLRDMNLASIPEEVIYSHVGHGVRDLMQGAIQAAHGEEAESAYLKAMELFDKYYCENLTRHTRLFPGMQGFLQRHQAKDMAVITNKPQKYTDPIIDGLNLRGFFGPVLGREACPDPKPHPAPVYKVLETYPVNKARAVIIGDTEVDIEAGRRAGIKTCGVLYGFGNPELVKAAQPDFVAETVDELLALFP